jgi:2-polyprenyl-6-hydroxyphenyl methylase/3-demethylubiquinone-9 3-methyltransferase
MSKLRFEFGKNWKNYLKVLNKTKINDAQISLKKKLDLETLNDKTFLDVGSGSGLFSLAVKNLGAKVVAFDFDHNSVFCTNELKKNYYKDSNNFKVFQGSILDKKFIITLGKFDIVYSWGVLHHTGNMRKALENILLPMKKNALLYISIYNHQPFATKYWSFVKRTYNQYCFSRPFWLFLHFFYPTLPSILLRFFQKRKKERGMTVFYDLIDWLGGYPFEVATPQQIFNFFKTRIFTLINLKTVGGSHGCNEFVFKKNN